MSAERGAPRSWKDISHGLKGQRSYFYAPFIADPVTHGTLFGGLADVWRTRDDGATDWERLVPASPYGELVSAVARAPSDTSTLWVGRGDGTLEVSTNADAAIAQDVRFTSISSGQTPFRYVSSIVVDPADATHAWVAYSGYEAYTPSTPGHVFSVRFNPADGTAAFTDISNGIGDQPVNAVAYDPGEHDLYAATDFGVMRLPNGATTWAQAAPGLPANVAIYGLTFSAQRRVLYAATHGRSAYSIDLVGAVPAARPQTTLTSGPSGELASRTVSFSFAANPPDGASFTCKLDGRARPCSSPTTYRHVRNGPHTFSVAAKNINGADLTPAGRSFSVRVDHIRLRLRPARTTLGAVLRRGLLVKAFCAPSCSVRMKLRLHGRRSAVASGRAPAGGRWFRLHLSRKERRALRHARRATFVLRARAIAPGTTAGHERTDVIVFR
jgi:hypothetical protein